MVLLPLPAVGLAAGVVYAAATVVPPMPFSEIVRRSDLIVAGTVTRIESRYEQNRATIRTYVTLEGLQVFKGTAGAKLVLRLEGGRIGADVLDVPLMPRFKLGARYLCYVSGNGEKLSPITGFHQGLFEIVRKGGREVLVNQQGLELIGIRNDRFVFRAPAPKKTAAPKVALADSQVVPAHPDADRLERELLRRRTREEGRPVAEAPAPTERRQTREATAKAPSAPPAPSRVAPLVRRRPVASAAPIFVPASKDRGERLSLAGIVRMSRSVR